MPGPTEPGLRAAGGSGLDAIWCEASVMPYASSTGAPNVASSSGIVSGASDALLERMNRRLSAPAGRVARFALRAAADASSAPPSTRWPVIACRRPERQRVEPRRHDDRAAVANVASVEASKPCTWNSGITHSATSSPVSW